MPINYQEGKIYKIVSYNTMRQYIGSTCQTLSQRLGGHVRDYSNYNEGKRVLYCTSFEIIDDENYRIELIENFPCTNRTELRSREGFYIRNEECVNKYIAGRNKKGWYRDNKEILSEERKERYKNNKKCELKRNKLYYEKNKEKIRKIQKKYYEKNKEKINKDSLQKIICDCGRTYAKKHKTTHFKSIIHKKLMEEINNELLEEIEGSEE
jgi:hypothetical protein